MSPTPKLSRHQASEFLEGLRRDISAARLRVSLDRKLGRDTPQSVKKLAALPDPPVISDTDDGARDEATTDSVHLAWAKLITSQVALKRPFAEHYRTGKPAYLLFGEVEEELWPGVAEASSERGTSQR